MTAMPRLPQPLTPDSLRGLMSRRAYWDANDPRFPAYQRLVRRGFEILYPGPVRRDDTGNMIDTPPLPPHFVARQVEQANAEMDVESLMLAQRVGLETPADPLREHENADQMPGHRKTGQVHVQSHARDGGKTEVSDYWRAAPGQGSADKDETARNDSGGDAARGQAGEDDLAQAGQPPTGAFVAPDPDRLAREWTGTRQGPNEAEKFECVGLVKAAVPEIGSTKTWREGERIIGPEDPPLEPGTAIATFDESGRYANKSGESHAAIFMKYDTVGGQQGIWVLDQEKKREAGRRFIRFDGPSTLPVNQAERFAVIKKGP